MASDNAAEIDRIKELVRERIRRVPQSVLAGGMKQSQAYKEVVEKANKLLASPRATLLKAQSVLGSLNSFT